MLPGISTHAIVSIFVLSAVVFALVYSPIVTKLSRGWLSPYAKADVGKRECAATTDSLIVVTTCLLYWTSDLVLYLAAGAAYVLLRDAIKGQSIGKFLFGLVVISIETGRPSSWFRKAERSPSSSRSECRRHLSRGANRRDRSPRSAIGRQARADTSC